MENPTPGVSTPEKSPDEIERDMASTRDAITEKVSLLENHVKDTLQTVTGTVEAVKEAVTTAPSTVSDTVKNTVEAVKDTVKDTVRDTIQSIDVPGCIQRNPWAALGTSALGGFLTGYFLLGGGRSRPIMARGEDEPASGGWPGTAGRETVSAPRSHTPGMFDELFGTVRRELRQMAEMALASATAALKQNISTVVPGLVDQAVHRVADQAGACPTEATRVNGPDYAARS